MVLGLRQINTYRKVPLQVNFLDNNIFTLPSTSLIFLGSENRPENTPRIAAESGKKCPPVMVIGRKKNKVKDRGGAFTCFSCLQAHKVEKG